MWWEDLTRGQSEHFPLPHLWEPWGLGVGGGGGAFLSWTQLKAMLCLREGGAGAPDGELPNHSGSRAAHWKW